MTNLTQVRYAIHTLIEREYGLPAVVGEHATSIIKDGQWIKVTI